MAAVTPTIVDPQYVGRLDLAGKKLYVFDFAAMNGSNTWTSGFRETLSDYAVTELPVGTASADISVTFAPTTGVFTIGTSASVAVRLYVWASQ